MTEETPTLPPFETPLPAETAMEPEKAVSWKDPDSAFWHIGPHLRLWLITAGALLLDLWSKHWAFTELDARTAYGDGYEAISGFVIFRRSLNAGALFGLGKGLTPVFIGASLLAFGFVLFLFIHSRRNRFSLHIGLALVLAGALGNLFDRSYMIADVVHIMENGREIVIPGRLIENPAGEPVAVATWPEGEHLIKRFPPGTEVRVEQMGVVRDFIKLQPHITIKGYNVDLWPWIFNIADVLLVTGVFLLMWNFWWERKMEKRLLQKTAALEAKKVPVANTDG